MSVARAFTAEQAAQIVGTMEARGANYGEPEDNFAFIADLWRLWVKKRHGVDVPFSAFDVGMMNADIKKARLATSPSHTDSALDSAVYTLLATGCVHSTIVGPQGGNHD